MWWPVFFFASLRCARWWFQRRLPRTDQDEQQPKTELTELQTGGKYRASVETAHLYTWETKLSDSKVQIKLVGCFGGVNSCKRFSNLPNGDLLGGGENACNAFLERNYQTRPTDSCPSINPTNQVQTLRICVFEGLFHLSFATRMKFNGWWVREPNF